MRTLSLSIAFILLPLSAFAEKVALLPPEYRVVETGTDSPELSAMVEQSAVQGAKEAGWETLTGSTVAAAAESAAGGPASQCRNEACLGKVADALGVDEVIFISIFDFDGHYKIAMFQARGKGEIASPYGNDTILLSTVSGLVKGMLLELSPKTADVPPPAEEPPPPDEPEAEPEPETQDEKKDGLAPTAFWVSLGVTGALAVSWGIVEGVGYSRYKDLDTNGKDMDYWDSTRSLQIADRILFPLACAGAATTIVLFFLTDFEGGVDEGNNQAYSIAPVLSKDAGFLVLEGRF